LSTPLLPLLRHGSRVSLYTDGPIRLHPLTPDLTETVLSLLYESSDPLAVVLRPGSLEVEMVWLADLSDFEELTADLEPGAPVLVGSFPASIGDAVAEFVVPDADGVIRMHPH